MKLLCGQSFATTDLRTQNLRICGIDFSVFLKYFLSVESNVSMIKKAQIIVENKPTSF